MPQDPATDEQVLAFLNGLRKGKLGLPEPSPAEESVRRLKDLNDRMKGFGK